MPSPYEEAQANRFAAELLMPRSTVEHLFKENFNRATNELLLLRLLANAFEVSSSAIQYRLVNLGLMLPIKG